MLRCTLAGMIPLMASKKYSVLAEVFYEYRRGDFENIIKSGSYYLIREIPHAIAYRLLAPRIADILSLQAEDGLWPGEDRIKATYDILSAFRHIHVLDSLRADARLKDVLKTLRENYDYYSLLIKSRIFGETSPVDEQAITQLALEIKNRQLSDGSFDHTVFATAYQIQKLMSLGVTEKDVAMQKAGSFLFEHLNRRWEAGAPARPGRGVQGSYVFSTQSRITEFRSALKYQPETKPRKASFCCLGIMQSAYCIKTLIVMGVETDARVQAAMEGILSLIEQYQGLCYFEIQNKWEARHNIYALN